MPLSSQSAKKLALCRLDDIVELIALDNCFMLDVKAGECPHRFYYSWIGEALRAYILYSLRRFAKKDPDGDIKKIIDAIDQLDMRVSTAAIQMSGNLHAIKSQIEERLNDPVEQEIARRGFLWNLGV